MADRDQRTPGSALRWVAPLFNYSGYAHGARYFPKVLVNAGLEVQAVPFGSDARFIADMTRDESRWWLERMESSVNGRPCVVTAGPVSPFGDDLYRMFRTQHSGCSQYLGYLAWETPRLPDTWVDACLGMDEIWVPSSFNRDALLASGMPAEQVHVVPIGIDFERYNPAMVSPLKIPGARGFVFLSVFEWSLRKGWDVLLRAYHRAFSRDDEVTLVIRSYRRGRDQRWIESQIRRFETELGVPERRRARIVLLDRFVPESSMASLYAAADAYVLPSRGEGWGIPFVEAMAMERPTVGTRWGGNLDFMNGDNSFLVPCRERPVPRAGWADNPNAYHYRGHVWAEPSVEALSAQLRAIVDNPSAARTKAKRARVELMAHLAPQRIAGQVANRLQMPERRGATTALIPQRLLRQRQRPNVTANGIASVKPREGAGALLVGRPDIWHSVGDDTTYLWTLEQRLKEHGIATTVATATTPDAAGYGWVYVVGGRDALTMVTQVAAARASCTGKVVLLALRSVRNAQPGQPEWPHSTPDPGNRKEFRRWLRENMVTEQAAPGSDVETERLERLASRLADVTVVETEAELNYLRDGCDTSSNTLLWHQVPALPGKSPVCSAGVPDAGRPLVVVSGATERDWNHLLVLSALDGLDVRVVVLLKTQDEDYAALCREAAPSKTMFVDSVDPCIWAQYACQADVYVTTSRAAAADPLRYQVVQRGGVVVMPANCLDMQQFGGRGFAFSAVDPDQIAAVFERALQACSGDETANLSHVGVDAVVDSACKKLAGAKEQTMVLAKMFLAKARSDYEYAERLIVEMGDSLSRDPEWQFILGELLLKAGDTKGAERCFELVSRVGHYTAVAERRLAHVRLVEGDYSAATALIRTILADRPDDGRCLQDMGEIALLENKAKDAVRWLEETARIEPRNIANWLHLGDAYRLVGEPTRAAKAYAGALRLDGNLDQAVKQLLKTNLTRDEACTHVSTEQQCVSADRSIATGGPAVRECGTLGVNVIGYASGNLGIGVTARNVIQVLLDRSIPVGVYDLDPGLGRDGHDRRFDALTVGKFEDLPHKINLFVLPPASIAALKASTPEWFDTTRLNVGFSMWELPHVPKQWASALEELDILVAESEFIRYAFQFSLNKARVVSADHPLYLPANIEPDRARFGLPDDAVVFVTSFEPFSDPARKNPGAVVDAFLAGVGHDPRAHLVFKLNNAAVDGRMHASVKELKERAADHPRIHLLAETLAYHEVLSLYASCDAFVSLHRAEGLGLALMECMALGKPVVATAWSGNLSFMNHTNSCLVGYQLVPVDGTIPAYSIESLGEDAMWADPDVVEAAVWMRRLADDANLRREIGERARADMGAFRARAERGKFVDELLAIAEHRQIKEEFAPLNVDDPGYRRWMQQRGFRNEDARLLAERMATWVEQPTIHAMLAYTGDVAALATTVESLSDQVYPNWVFTVFATVPAVASEFEQMGMLEWVQVATPDSLAASVRRSVEGSNAELIAWLHVGDRLEPHAFWCCVDGFKRHPGWQLLYSDEDQIDSSGRRVSPSFKPDFNLDLARSTPYVGGISMTRRSAWLAVDSFRLQNGLEDHEIALRVFERHGGASIGHVPEILCHRRSGNSNVNADDSRRLIEEHLRRMGVAGEVCAGLVPGTWYVDYRHPLQPKVSIVVPTRDRRDLLEACVESLLEKTDYPEYEIIIVDNQSSDPAAIKYLENLPTRDSRIRVLRYDRPYNFAALNNAAAQTATGDYLLLLNNDTVIVQDAWLRHMMTQAQRPEVGVVGARLVFPDQRVQHAGIILGMGDNGVAEHPHIGVPMDHPGYMARAQVVQDFSAVTGACLLIRRALFDQVGGMDADNFAVMYNDVDLCLKVRESGHLVVWTPLATVVHYGSASLGTQTLSGAERERAEREISAMCARWLPQLAHDPAYNRNLSLLRKDFSCETEVLPRWSAESMDKPRLMALGFGSDGSWAHRGVIPLNALDRDSRAEIALLPKHRDRVRVPTVAELARAAPDALLVHNGVHDTHLEALERYRSVNDIFLVFGQDDLMIDLPAYNQFRDTVYPDMKQRLRRAMRACHRLMVTTEPLADAYRDWADDIRVVPNYLDRNVWEPLRSLRSQGDKPRVGWAGAQQHTGDLELLFEVVKETADEIQWVFFGLCFEEWLPFGVEVHNPVEFHEYPQKLASLNLDLAVAPLVHNRFNECKSNLKILEYGALGVPAVCTDIEPYRNAPVARVRNTGAAWLNAIRERLADLDALGAEGDRMRRWVLDHWMLQGHLDTWLDALSVGAVETAAKMVGDSR